MNIEPATLLIVSLWGYVTGTMGGLLFMRREKLANVFSFGAAALSGLSGLLAAFLFLTGGTPVPQMELLPSFIPYIQFTMKLDPLGEAGGDDHEVHGEALRLDRLNEQKNAEREFQERDAPGPDARHEDGERYAVDKECHDRMEVG